MSKLKKETAENKILKFLLEQQLPEARVAGTSINVTGYGSGSALSSSSTIGYNKSNSNSSNNTIAGVSVTAVDHVEQIALETCRCVHLQEHLPHLLDLELCKAPHHPRGWVVANPVHSMHLKTQLEDAVPAFEHNKQPPVLYGEEQQRTMALNTEGIVEHWCPLDGYSTVIHDDTAMDKMEHMPTLRNINDPLPSTSPVKTSTNTKSDEETLNKHTVKSLFSPSSSMKGIPIGTTLSKSKDVIPIQEPDIQTSKPVTSTLSTSSTLTNTDQKKSSSATEIVTTQVLSTNTDEEIVATTKSDNGSPPDRESKDEISKGTLNAATSAVDTNNEVVSMDATLGTLKKEDKKDISSPKSEISKEAEVPEELKSSTAEIGTKESIKDSTESGTATDKVESNIKTTKGTTSKSTEGQDIVEGDEKRNKEKEDSNEAKSVGTSEVKEDDLTMQENARESSNNDHIAGSREKELVEKDSPEMPKVKNESNEKQNEVETKRDDAITPSPMDLDNTKTETKSIEGTEPTSTPSMNTVLPTNILSEQAVPMVLSDNLETGKMDLESKPNAAPLPVSSAEEKPKEEPEETYNHLRIEEDRIRLIRRSLSSHRILPKKKVDPKKRVDPKKKRKREDMYRTPGIPGWHASNLKELNQEQERQWSEAADNSCDRVERWLDNFRSCRQAFWLEQEVKLSPPRKEEGPFYLTHNYSDTKTFRYCQACHDPSKGGIWRKTLQKETKNRRKFYGDDLLQCLECGFIGCSPRSICRDSKQHISEHLLLSGHKFAMTCGERGQIFCFCCGDFVYHEVFEQERARIDLTKQLPTMAWKPHQLYRSFDPFHFMKTQDHGIVWRGLVAKYPQLVPPDHIAATAATSIRQAMFDGNVLDKRFAHKPLALSFAASCSLLKEARNDKFQIKNPVGMYNLGNTCYKSAVLQCLVHCAPLQQYFLKDNGHHYHSCQRYRQWELSRRNKKKRGMPKPEEMICLACEMDRLFLAYYGNTLGIDVLGAVEEACRDGLVVGDKGDVEKGDPLVISEMLTASWKSGAMNSVASYKQHDSHEFLNQFLELVGKQTKKHWIRVLAALNSVKSTNSVVSPMNLDKQDIAKQLFEGSLSSVLLCDECGTKRKRSEEFLNVSLSLSEEVARRQSDVNNTSIEELSVETCLDRFVSPEKLGDGVDCPSCAKKTATQKQHTFGSLPKVLCLHLKRFDAAQNKKIDDFVSFPAEGLNMGKYLSQWCEVSRFRSVKDDSVNVQPQINYDLFGTVNHVGSLSSGHYLANVKVDDRWYKFNDSLVSLAGGDGGAETVVSDAGAYILFYLRRS